MSTNPNDKHANTSIKTALEKALDDLRESIQKKEDVKRYGRSPSEIEREIHRRRFPDD